MFILFAFNILAFLWLLAFAVFAFRELAFGNSKCIYYLFLIHFFFCGMPLLLDVCVGVPTCRQQPGYYYSYNDTTTCVIYCLYISLIPLIWHFTNKSDTVSSDNGLQYTHTGHIVRYLTFSSYTVLLLSPIAAVGLSPEPWVYFSYGAFVTENLPQNIVDYHSIVNISSIMCVVGVSGIMLNKVRVNRLWIILFVLVFIMAIWVNGKRNIVVIIFCSCLYIGITRKVILGRRLLLTTSIFGAIFVIFNYVYENYVRYNGGINGHGSAYDSYRLDYGRDGVIKFTIYAELHPEQMRILEYRGQSVLFDLLIYCPRSIMPNKPWPYAEYITSAMLFRKSYEYIGWSVTTSWLEESIANFGWSGMLIGPLLLSLICRLGDNCRDKVTQALTVLISSLLLSVHFAAFSPLVILWSILIIRYYGSKKYKGLSVVYCSKPTIVALEHRY